MVDAEERQLQTAARLAGFSYLLQNLLFFASLIITSRMVVTGDFAATVRNIAGSETLYRTGLSIGVAASASTTFLGLGVLRLAQAGWTETSPFWVWSVRLQRRFSTRSSICWASLR